MREFIDKAKSKEIKKRYKEDADACYIEINGKHIKDKGLYFEHLRDILQLNETFSNNYNAYSDMMRDSFTYYNKKKIIFLIKHYEKFLRKDDSKSRIEVIFDEDIIPFFEEDIEQVVKDGSRHEIHVYCVVKS